MTDSSAALFAALASCPQLALLQRIRSRTNWPTSHRGDRCPDMGRWASKAPMATRAPCGSPTQMICPWTLGISAVRGPREKIGTEEGKFVAFSKLLPGMGEMQIYLQEVN
ncbi:hypothetical protein AVEN_65207-1 [Araneus ventricosus]|uniref:Uncharacterized protein n=1 Tax=Araneus ventricosus TaxID=182803 RepID=A0A4Y2AFI4_ARAVE|nr:hypothetical protein AVEN_65207-1 [Araneus ventricosus]